MGGVEEFWGERLVGMLQQLKTNGKFGEMEQTMMTKIIGQQQLLVNEVIDKINGRVTGANGEQRKYGMVFSKEEYTLLLNHVHACGGYKDV
ncbi:hypothetical protein O181_076878 [Austropuccinia psidii MF-1]|uniref:Uncharacterized protein n=1 Tax=Austropuccinia psidii MF-1 TaxID=1389203 RepID=A0A9Q3FFX9_9BASI|nr:hypothetical protein [Austropuccinia psidii MF-1]